MSDQPSSTILVPTNSRHQVEKLFPLIVPLARANDSLIVLLHVWQIGFSGQGSFEGNDEWLDEMAAALEMKSIQTAVERRSGHNISGTIREVVNEIDPVLLVLSWRRSDKADETDPALKDLLLDVPCDLLVWRSQQDSPVPRRILIPSAGGPNAEMAIRLAEQLSSAYDGEVTLMSVLSSSADKTAFQETHETLRQEAEERASDTSPEAVRILVERANSPQKGILSAANSGEFDLVMIGASREGVINRILFGELAERVAASAQIPVLVIKRPLPRAVTLARQLWTSVQAVAPQLTENEKIEVYRDIRYRARAGVDFFSMMALSTAIATLGLMLNSPAVVIGAMLVAPLMSAIVALGLAIVQGDARLLRLSLSTTARGVAISVGVAFLIGLLIPGDRATNEVLSRASPSLFDLGVALASGAAGAYALCRKDVSTSLPGVAIAVALVPPLATIGLALSQLAWGVAAGASLLFLTNLVAIAAMGGFVFLLLGFQPEPNRHDRMRLFARGWSGLIFLLILVSLPLGWLTIQNANQANFARTLEHTLESEMAEIADVHLRGFETEEDDEGVLRITAEVESTRTLFHYESVELQANLAEALGRTVALVLKVIPTTVLDPLDPPDTSTPVTAGD